MYQSGFIHYSASPIIFVHFLAKYFKFDFKYRILKKE